MNPRVSVIVPVYNASRWLNVLSDRLAAQTFGNFEAIFIDDGSTDNSASILRALAAHDRRIRILQTSNHGAGRARNEGLALARGDYTYFLDADDAIHPELLARTVAFADKATLDIVVFGAYSCRFSGNRILSKARRSYAAHRIPARLRAAVFSGDDMGRDLFRIPQTAWCKLFRTSFLRDCGAAFSDLPRGQDQYFFLHTQLAAQRIGVLNCDLYYYRKNTPQSGAAKNVRRSTWAVDLCRPALDLLDRLGKTSAYRAIVLDRYLGKAFGDLGKAALDYKPAYCEKLRALQADLRIRGIDGWWTHVRPTPKDSYASLKIKQYFAKWCAFLKKN